MDIVDTNKFPNVDLRVAESFSDEWAFFPQDKLTDVERESIFLDYFGVFPWARLKESDAVGADVGCGSGRWAGFVAPRVKKLFCLDVSLKAIEVASKNLKQYKNVEFLHVSVGNLPFEDESLDFAYCLGVLHHLPDPEAALRSITKKLKPGAPFLVYLYYAFDNRPKWYRKLWNLSDVFRVIISSLPFKGRYLTSQFMAYFVYLPFARLGKLLDSIGIMPRSWPLAYYRDKSLYVIRTDALDRFGTPLEKRFTKEEFQTMLEKAGFGEIKFSDRAPFWVAVGIKK